MRVKNEICSLTQDVQKVESEQFVNTDRLSTPPGREVEYCDQFVCLSLRLSMCLSAREHN